MPFKSGNLILQVTQPNGGEGWGPTACPTALSPMSEPLCRQDEGNRTQIPGDDAAIAQVDPGELTQLRSTLQNLIDKIDAATSSGSGTPP